ncbi:MAG: 3-deoxy-8-phosphooctulonate synthase [Chlamydiae bacterium CG10_big_fil_rev_8_21_14_0_10_35_9]|nr:MAG: 3-deoxy-8-phosphooctulonate synthase [Chlamydiae bacterium CG10_big_fil_rev_8_21_14_0_10_35_9]
MREIKIKNFIIGKGHPLVLILGPCVIESESHTLQCAEQLKEITEAYPFPLIFKASYDKANRSSIHSYRGPGIEKGLQILQKVQKELDLPVVSDVHSPEEASIAGSVLDMIQIPAFLCRQTDLLVAAGKTKAAVNIKKGQFMAPWDMKSVVEKITSQGKEDILLTDRGTTFGYNNLVSDFRSLIIMQNLQYPVCYDASHSVQLPGGLGSSSGGQREFIPPLAKAAVAIGTNALFMECHPNPPEAKSDKMSVLDFATLKHLLPTLHQLQNAIQESSHA